MIINLALQADTYFMQYEQNNAQIHITQPHFFLILAQNLNCFNIKMQIIHKSRKFGNIQKEYKNIKKNEKSCNNIDYETISCTFRIL